MWLQHKPIKTKCIGASIALLCALLCSGCGFHPMYGAAATQAGKTSGVQGNITIATMDNSRFGQILKSALEDRFNPQGLTNSTPDYTLKTTLTRSLISSVVRSDGTILRYDVRFESDYTLVNNSKDPKDKGAVYTGKIRRTNSYNVVPNANFATYEAEENLNERMLREIAEDYVLRISGHLAGSE